MYEIVMSGPGKNSLGTTLMRHVREELVKAGGQPVLLTGEGDSFSAGLNLKELATLDASGIESFLRLLTELTLALYLYPGPTVALVNGHAIAGGCILTLCCDVRVAIDNPKARIGLNEVAIGLRFPPFLYPVIRQRVPGQHLEEVVLQAGLHSPAEALRLGLVDAVSSTPRETALERLEKLAAIPRPAYVATKLDLRQLPPVSEADEQVFRRDVLPVWTGPGFQATLAKALGK